MAEFRVVAIEVGDGSASVPDPHVTAICLEDGRRIPRRRAVTNLQYGVEAYYTEIDGARARLRVVDPCSRCGEAYLRADEGATLPDKLLSLPPCPPRAAEPAKPRREGAARGGPPSFRAT